ncbi:Homeobox-leucine zipper protein like [Melia azedarach]|uniref:Homeobox-leucine zipper protein like n=1 Tax=Melia azedarach TaxID=155640 RepID=A0ACC1Z1Y9_MELAZ|nr:Homeobox-leucine zipper protein like [Melia azedarach]
MDLQFNSTKNGQLWKPNRKRLTQDQISLLETCFNANQKLKVDCKLELAHRLGLPPRQVAVWYQNRRAREKIHTIELDYKTIRQELEKVLAENTRLEEEVGKLKHELSRTRQMLLVSPPPAPLLPLMSTSDDSDHVSEISPGNMICCWEDAELLPVEGLYSCPIGSQGQPEEQCRNDLSFQSVTT